MNTTQIWYAQLIKPEWAPSSSIFGPVWTFLYILMAISFGYIFFRFLKKKIKQQFVLPFILNIIFNLIFVPIQFGLKNNILATTDILFVLTTLIWVIKVSWKKYRWVAIVNIPYLAWVSFATILQLTVTYLNW